MYNVGALSSSRVAQHNDDAVTAEEHFADEAVLIDGLRLLFALACLGHLGPHLLDIFENHVTVAIKGLDTAK